MKSYSILQNIENDATINGTITRIQHNGMNE